MMQDPFPVPSCLAMPSSDDPTSAAAGFSAIKPGQSIVSSVHRTKIAGHSRLITITWCRNLFLHGLCVSVERSESQESVGACKVELKPWCFWRKQGSKKFDVDGKHVHVFWDLRNASFSGEPEPRSGYYVAVVCDDEVALMLGDMKKEAYKRTACRPSAIDAILVSKKEHVFGKKKFATKMRFRDKGRQHEILIECGSSGSGGKLDPQMVMKIDGQVTIHVKHLQWKFRGNETISLNKQRVEVYWDVHDWLFSPGLSHALFIFKPLPTVRSSLITASNNIDQAAAAAAAAGSSSSFCMFLYAWKIE